MTSSSAFITASQPPRFAGAGSAPSCRAISNGFQTVVATTEDSPSRDANEQCGIMRSQTNWREFISLPARLKPSALARDLLRDSSSRAWTIMTGASVARLAVGFVASVLIARALGPADLGIYATLAAVASIVGAFSEFGLTESAVRRIASLWPSEARKAGEVAATYVWTRLALTALIVAALSVALGVGALIDVTPWHPLLLLARVTRCPCHGAERCDERTAAVDRSVWPVGIRDAGEFGAHGAAGTGVVRHGSAHAHHGTGGARRGDLAHLLWDWVSAAAS